MDTQLRVYTHQDADGRTFDFHATRHSFITLLARAGVHPKMAQELARHSSIDLTMNAYTHLKLRDRAAAVEARPSLLPQQGEPTAPALAATGTGPRACTKLAHANATKGPELRRIESEADVQPGNAAGPNPQPLQGIEAGEDQEIPTEEGVGEGTRTPDFQIHSLGVPGRKVVNLRKLLLRDEHGCTLVAHPA